MTEIDSDQGRAPEQIWKTIFERAIFSYYVETNNAQYFVNDYYVEKLCRVENNINQKFAKLSTFTVVFSIFSVALSQNTFSDVTYQGIEIAKLPYVRQLCVLFLGPLIAANVIFMLDILTVSRMRSVIFSHSHSEVPNMRMLHWKENNAWVDAIIPKYVGYSSGVVHTMFTIFSLIWVMAIPASLLFLYISAQIVVFLSVDKSVSGFFQAAITYLGLFVSIGSVLVVVITLMIPLPFKLKRVAPIDVEDLGIPDEGSPSDGETEPPPGSRP